MAIDSASTSLAPGFRFHPTDEELVRYYLRRKICGKSFRLDAISDVDVYKCEPWDLPGRSRLKSRDLEWYFFSVLDKKHGNGSKTNRATDRGYWKTTGKDRPVLHRSRTVGMKKTLVYHSGRAPRGERTNWVMHEYRATDEDLEKAGIVQDAFVLCRIFQKSGTGPKNGEQYGAPFNEEEWDNDDVLVMVPGERAAEELVVGDEAYLDENDIEQILTGIPLEAAPVPLNYNVDEGNYVEETKVLVNNNAENLSVAIGDDLKALDLPAQNDVDSNPVKNEYIGESSNTWNPEHEDYLLDEPFLDATGYQPFDEAFLENNDLSKPVEADPTGYQPFDEAFLETNDLSKPVEADPTGYQPFDEAFLETNDLSKPVEADPTGYDMLEEYLTYFDADDDESKYLVFDSSKMIESESPVWDQESFNQMVDEAKPSQQLLEEHNNAFVAHSKQEPAKSKSDAPYFPFKYASRMLASIPAPPAYASEFPTKNAILRMDGASHSSRSNHFTAGMVRIGNMNLSGSGSNMSFDKLGNVNVVLSLGLSYSNVDSACVETYKDRMSMSRGWFYLMFLWVLILSISVKIGTCIYSGSAY